MYSTAPRDETRLSRENFRSQLRGLLENRRIHPNEELFEQTEDIAAIIGGWDTTSPDRFDMTAVVYGRDGRPIPLEGISMTAKSASLKGTPVMRMARFKRRGKDRGHVNFLNLPTGAYLLTVPDTFGESDETIDFLLMAESRSTLYGNQTNLKQIAEVPHTTPAYELDRANLDFYSNDQRSLMNAYTYLSDDGQITATVRQTENNTAFVSFLTKKAIMAAADVHFAFVTAHGSVEVAGTVQLQRRRDEHVYWEGHWEERFQTSVPCKLVFEVFMKTPG